MVLHKKERRTTIAVGLILGITLSSMIVRHALKIKDEQAAHRPGNYDSQYSAAGNVNFPPLPDEIKRSIPNGIVVYFEGNRSSLSGAIDQLVDCWVIETSGSFRSERLFILAEADCSSHQKIKFLRSTELYLTLAKGTNKEDLKNELDHERFSIIGQNSLSGEHIVQVRNFSPTELENARAFLNSMNLVASTRLSPWEPIR